MKEPKNLNRTPVLLLQKKWSKDNLENYRLISLLNIVQLTTRILANSIENKIQCKWQN